MNGWQRLTLHTNYGLIFITSLVFGVLLTDKVTANSYDTVIDLLTRRPGHVGLCQKDTNFYSCLRRYSSMFRQRSYSEPGRDDNYRSETSDNESSRNRQKFDIWNLLCPPDIDQAECQEKIQNQMRQISAKPRRAFQRHADVTSGGIHSMGKRSRLNWQLCPHSLDKLECFENYMALYLHMVNDQDKLKRIPFPGRRSLLR